MGVSKDGSPKKVPKVLHHDTPAKDLVKYMWRIPNSSRGSNVSPSRKQRNKEESEHAP